MKNERNCKKLLTVTAALVVILAAVGVAAAFVCRRLFDKKYFTVE